MTERTLEQQLQDIYDELDAAKRRVSVLMDEIAITDGERFEANLPPTTASDLDKRERKMLYSTKNGLDIVFRTVIGGK